MVPVLHLMLVETETVSFFATVFLPKTWFWTLVQATAGLRALGTQRSEEILQAVNVLHVLSIKIWAFHLFFSSLIFFICILCAAYSLLVLNCLFSFCCCWIWVLQVRELLHDSSFKSQPNWVTVLDGSQEGAFQWVRCYSNLLQSFVLFLFCCLGLLTLFCTPSKL